MEIAGIRVVFGYDARANPLGPDRSAGTPGERESGTNSRAPVQESAAQRGSGRRVFPYQPTACTTTYGMVFVRQNISLERGDQRLFDEIRYFFYPANDNVAAAGADVILFVS